MPELLKGTSPDPVAARASFRYRLTLTLGAALAGTFVFLGLLAWVVVYGWQQYDARSRLLAEAREVAAIVATPGGGLRPNRYAWYEPHHRFAEPRIDPYFLQVFDADGRLLRASQNMEAFAPDPYGWTLFDTTAASGGWYEPLRYLQVAGTVLYAEIWPIDAADGGRLGYVQVSRFDPGIGRVMRRLALGLALGLSVLLAGLLGLVRVLAGRVLRPLETITDATRAISTDDLSRRYPIPPEADRETAQLAQTLNTLLARLERSFDETQRFTSNAAHELQTPLTILRGHVDIALRRPRTTDAYRETLQLLGDEIDHLVRMVRGLLTLARLDRGVLPAGRRADLSALLREEAAPFAAQAEGKGLAFTLTVPETLPIDGQPELLEEVVRNLLDNAVKYTDAGTITVRLTLEGATARLAVCDTGMGIPPDERARVTARFYRSQAAQGVAAQGHGLGLSIVAQIVAWHGGTLDVRDAPGGGTCVEVRLQQSSS